jgi:hypothetical protein
MTRTNMDAARDAVRDLTAWLAGLDWLTDAAWVLTLGCLGCAILDSYTSLCVVGGSLGHIGSATACPDFGGWDTRVFPLAVDMGWGGALFAVLRLARSIGLKSWRWWVVLTFEALTAAFTIAGNAFHGAVVDGATSHLTGSLMVVISSVASAVPGIVAVGSGFTLSVLVSTRPAALSPRFDQSRGVPVEQRDEPQDEQADEPNRPARVPARAEVRRLLKRRGNAVTAEQVADRVGVSIQHARRLLRQERELRVVGARQEAGRPSAGAEV